MFELETFVKARLADVVVLSQKNRQPDDNPGAKLSLEFVLPSDMLVNFDGRLRNVLFEKGGGGQGHLEGIESEVLTSIGGKIGKFGWDLQLAGYTMTLDLGLGGKKSNLVLGDCLIDNWRLQAQDGGSCLAHCNVESPDVSEAHFGKLAKLKSREISFKLTPPEMSQEELAA